MRYTAARSSGLMSKPGCREGRAPLVWTHSPRLFVLLSHRVRLSRVFIWTRVEEIDGGGPGHRPVEITFRPHVDMREDPPPFEYSTCYISHCRAGTGDPPMMSAFTEHDPAQIEGSLARR